MCEFWAVAAVQLVYAFFWDVMPRHWVTGAGRAEATESTEDAAIVVTYVIGDRKLCAVRKQKCTRIGVTGSLVRGSRCRKVWYKNRSDWKFSTRVEVSGSLVQESE